MRSSRSAIGRSVFLALTVMAVAGAPVSAEATSIELAYQFTASGFQSAHDGTVAPFDPLSGSFVLKADDSGITGTGLEFVLGTAEFFHLAIGSTTFGPADIDEVSVFFLDGELSGFFVGSSCSPSGCWISRADPTEDFFSLEVIDLYPAAGDGFMSYGLVSQSDSWWTGSPISGVFGTLTLSPIPEPSGAVLFLAGGLLVSRSIRRRASG
jgi:hypothetical protein